MKSRIKLNHEVEAFLTSNQSPISYGRLATMFNTGARAIGSCMRAIAKRNPEITRLVIKS